MSAKWRKTLRIPTCARSATCWAVGSSTPSPTQPSIASTMALRLRSARSVRPSRRGAGLAIGEIMA